MKKPFKEIECDLCHSIFKSVSFNKHRKACDGSGKLSLTRKIAANQYEITSDGKCKCPYCEKEFSPRGISAHIRFAHEGKRNYKPNVKYIPWNKGLNKKSNPELAEKLSAGGKALKLKIENGYVCYWSREEFWTEERRKLKSEEKKNFYELNPEAHPNRKVAGNRGKMTYPEKVCNDWLIKNGINFESQKKIGEKFVDFLVENSTVIEIDGERWHPIGNESDRIRDKYLTSIGLKVFRIRSKEKIEKRLEEIFSRRC